MAAETQGTQLPPPTSDHSTNAHGGSGDGGNAPTKQLKRACDCCRKRKVKCDGQDPCTPCKKASIRCAYLQPPKKKGPKGLRSARVLHALRRIDDTASQSPTSPHSPSAPFGNWEWGQNGSVPPGASYSSQMNAQTSGPTYGQQTSVAPDQQPYYQPMAPSQHHYPLPPYRPQPPHAPQRSWTQSTQAESASGSDGIPRVMSPSSTEQSHRMLSPETFPPYVQLFFNHMFAIMPVIDRSQFMDPSLYTSQRAMSPELYTFLCALCAATLVQLDDSIPTPPRLHPMRPTGSIFVEECLRERKTYDYVEHVSTMNLMTSFFLFAYYGNQEHHNRAWFHLQESITISENLNMDDEESYEKLDPTEAQWRRRLYWLLFITERAYAVQRRKHTRLHAMTVALPAVFESEDPQLLTGFVNLANLFSAVDDSFVSAWRGSRRASLCDEAWLVKTQKQLDATANAAGLGELTETQRLDISVTREWLHVLAWQMGVSNGLIWGQGEGGMRLDYPVELARKVVEITSGASTLALDSHGIGMEQKLSDIAGCLADVLKCTAGDASSTFLEGKQYLNVLLQRLSSMRGKESRYLRPLMAKMDGLMGFELSNATLPPPQEIQQAFDAKQQASSQSLQAPTAQAAFAPSSGQWSMRESVSMLRTLSMCGNLGMPSLSVPTEDWSGRRLSGRVIPVEEEELDLLQPWLQQTAVQSM
ncbi:hypothetical protein AC578_341 [Pseudocercospora eumusae]|uniref:Zn(2)-C6 fungal-type domain-containing protein n=1 Tax=Pseudocercospora eumusae TaxID=321146 RepID=A0A139HTW4_9PEZI|nr:hypothetical protein AC578_341 [Pseudocercospora eumusae]